MAQNVRGHNSPPSYVDGIYVKISERYKPPKRIAVALSYSQRLILNKLIQDPIPTYDFTLEESIKDKIHEWRKARTIIAEERRQRLQQQKQLEEEEEKQDKEHQSTETETNRTECTEVSNSTESKIINKNENKSYYKTESGVLIPMTVISTPITNHTELLVDNNNHHKHFINYSEFESDTSSPFDNMELKTINDLEELAEVLKRDTSPKQITDISLYDNNKKPSNQFNGYYYNHKPLLFEHNVRTQATASLRRTVPEIMKSLQADLEGTRVSENISSVAATNVTTASPSFAKRQDDEAKIVIIDELENPFASFSTDLQEMVVKISSMGFPLARVARACQMFDGNQKKIVEHLLALTDLLDLGFPEQLVVNALLKCNNDRDKALDLLIT